MNRETWIGKIIPALIFLSLWLDGWFFPLIIVPVLYVVVVEKKSLGWLGFSRQRLRESILIGLSIAAVLSILYYPLFLFYISTIARRGSRDPYAVLMDVLWYPVYEEVSYRAFFLTHFTRLGESGLRRTNIGVNLLQTLLFVVIHRNHFATPLILIPVFMLGLLNGLLFLRTRNAYGCLVSHSVLNGCALLIVSLYVR